MGELGLLRRPPSGWSAAVALPLRYTAASTVNSEAGDGDTALELSQLLDVTWEVRREGRAPYTVEDSRRRAPTWTLPTQLGGTGRRWYRLRLKRTYGLLPDVEVPCRVDPAEPGRLWIDWDAAYRNHEVAWDRRAALDRAVADQRGGLDKVAGRLSNPFGPAPTEADRVAAQRLLAEEAAELERQRAAAVEATSGARWAGVDPDEKAAFDAMSADLDRIHQTGRRTTGRVVAVVPLDRKMVGVQVKRIELEIQDGPQPRRVALELPLQPAPARRVPVGKEVSVWVDPDDPERICIA